MKLIKLVQSPKAKASRSTAQARKTTDLVAVGDLVEITNDYKGLKGVRGIVERTTLTQVVLNIGERVTTRRHFQNVKKVAQPSNDD